MEITQAEYEHIKHLMPIVRGNGRIDSLTALNAMLYIAENGCKWRSLPEKYGRWHTVYMKINRWAKSGVLERIFVHMKNLKFPNLPDTLYLDATIIKVHPHGAGCLKKTESKQSEGAEAVLPQRYIAWLSMNGKRTP